MLDTDELIVLAKLSKDLKASASILSPAQARYLVDLYYQMQGYRTRARNQERAAESHEEPHVLVSWVGDVQEKLENSIKSALDAYSSAHQAGRWAKAQHGIGPVIAAGLLAHIDPQIAKTAGAVWRFAGLDPTQTWNKSEKRPWNARLKVLCWKIGDSFVKQHNSPKCYYGKVYEERKALEKQRNESGALAEQAAKALQAKTYRRETKAKTAYEAGRLPDGHIDMRARRYAVKLFLSHYHEVAYEAAFGVKPPRPYVIEHLGHVDYVPPPGWPCA